MKSITAPKTMHSTGNTGPPAGVPGDTPSSPGGRLVVVWTVVFLVAAGLYLATMAPGLLWGDSADAQLRVLTGGWTDNRDLARAHTSYYLTARGLRAISGLSAARAANAVAALAGAVTVANIALLIALVVQRRPAWIAGTLLLLLSHTLWQMSCGAEVITYSTMCLSAELTLMVIFLRSHRTVHLAGAAFANGLGWTTHNCALLTWPAYIFLIWVLRKTSRRPSVSAFTVVGGAWIVGAAPLLLLAARAYAESGACGATIRSLFVGIYARQVFNHELSGGMVLRVAAYVMLNFPTPLLLLAPWGWFALRRSATSGVWLFLTVAAATFGIFGARYNVPDQYTFLVHAYLFLVLFVSVGVDRLLTARRSGLLSAAVIILALTAPLAYVLAPRVLRASPRLAARVPARTLPYRDTFAWFLQPWRSGYHGAERYARDVLTSLPHDAVLFADTTTRRPMMYLQAAEALRPDVRLGRNAQSAIQEERRFHMAFVDRLIAEGKLFSASDERGHAPDWLLEPRYRLAPQGWVYRAEPATPREADSPVGD